MPLFGPPDVEKLKAKGDVSGLIRALGYTGDASIRRAAATALGDLGDPRAVEPLSAALKNPDWWQHEWRDSAAAAEALGRLGGPAVASLISALSFHSQVVRIAATEALEKIGRPAVQPLIALLGDNDLETREVAGEVLTAIGSEAVEPLIEALHDPSTGRRVRAAKSLGDIGDPRAVEPLTQALADPHTGVRQVAARALGSISDTSVVAPLIAALDDPDQSVRRSAAQALGQMGDPHAVETLLTELRGPEWESAVDCLVTIGEPAVQPMIATLAESRARGDTTAMLDGLRSVVAGTLGRIGYPTEVASLITKLFASDRKARTDAASELIRLYQSGSLDRHARELILAARPTIEQPHEDGRPDGGPHADQGIGAPFPV